MEPRNGLCEVTGARGAQETEEGRGKEIRCAQESGSEENAREADYCQEEQDYAQTGYSTEGYT